MKNVLIIGSVWPEPKSSAAGSHMMQLISAFQSKKYEITFSSACAKTANAVDLKEFGIIQIEIQLNHSSFDNFIKELDPEIVVFDRFMTEEQFGWRVSEVCPNALKILNTEDLHCLRKGRHKALKENKIFDKRYLFNDIAKRELASIYRCDLSLIISEAELEILDKDFEVNASLLHYFPFLLESISEDKINKLARFEDRQHYVSIGNFLHAPNYDAVIYLKSVIWPLIRQQMPNAEMHIYGAYQRQKPQQLEDEANGFFLKGFANDVNEVMQKARVCIAPLRFGAGLKGKLVDAMQNGLPCVTTSVGEEGLFGELNPSGFIADDPQHFSDKAIALYNDKSIWKSKQKNGFLVINERFEKSVRQQDLLNRVEVLQEDLEKHRLHNFTGAMLEHHMLQSTKFMSKWIEEKNKLN